MNIYVSEHHVLFEAPKNEEVKFIRRIEYFTHMFELHRPVLTCTPILRQAMTLFPQRDAELERSQESEREADLRSHP